MSKEELEQQLVFMQRQTEQEQEKGKEQVQEQKTTFEQKAKLEQELFNHPHFMKEVNLDDPKLTLPFYFCPSKTYGEEGVYYITIKYHGRFQYHNGLTVTWSSYNVSFPFKITATEFILYQPKKEFNEYHKAHASLAALIKGASRLGLDSDKIEFDATSEATCLEGLKPTNRVTMQSLSDKGIKTEEQLRDYRIKEERGCKVPVQWELGNINTFFDRMGKEKEKAKEQKEKGHLHTEKSAPGSP